MYTATLHFAKSTQEGQAPDGAERFSNACLFLSRKAFGTSLKPIANGTFQPEQIYLITRFVCGIIFLLGSFLTVPLTGLGICVAKWSTTYNGSFAHSLLISDDVLRQEKSIKKLAAIFRYVIRSIPQDKFVNHFLTSGLIREPVGYALMESLQGHTAHLEKMAKESASDPKHLGPEHLIQYCDIGQFKIFIDQVQFDQPKIESIVKMLLQFFSDPRNAPEKNEFYNQAILYLCQTVNVTEFMLTNLDKHEPTRLQQIFRLLTIFEHDPIICQRIDTLV